MPVSTNIRVLETHYNGYHFRSRLEARWAVFFDALGVAYEYEKEGYDLGAAGWYLPDFWLPQYEWWIEIKGKEPTGSELAKAAALAAGDDDWSVFLVIGMPTACRFLWG